jgi:CRISPR-associated protein Cmr1
MSMIKKEFTVRFNTPAFLGDADQKGAWRTPPFKALLRQWWRVAAAGEKGVDFQSDRLREKEGLLFGHAWLKDEKGKHWAMKSEVLVRLTPWEEGRLTKLDKVGQVCHPEVNNPRMQPCPSGTPGRMVGADLYLGFGSVGTRGLSHERAISPSQSAKLLLGFPKKEQEIMAKTIDLIQVFGTLGGRSRNGWGSVVLQDEGLKDAWTVLHDWDFLGEVAKEIGECMHREWPHAIGRGEDGRLLVWRTPAKAAWMEVMRELARIKIAFRTSLKFTGLSPEERHVLAYPVTNHEVSAWGKENVRIPNQLRFKVIRGQQGFVGLAFHLPCKLPDKLSPSLPVPRQIQVWEKVHARLDKEMTRIDQQGGRP